MARSFPFMHGVGKAQHGHGAQLPGTTLTHRERGWGRPRALPALRRGGGEAASAHGTARHGSYCPLPFQPLASQPQLRRSSEEFGFVPQGPLPSAGEAFWVCGRRRGLLALAACAALARTEADRCAPLQTLHIRKKK